MAVDALATALLGLVLLFFPRPVADGLGLPEADPAVYANLAGAVLLGLALALVRAADAPGRHRAIVEGSAVAKGLAAVVLVLWLTALDARVEVRGVTALALVAAGLAALAALQARALVKES